MPNSVRIAVGVLDQATKPITDINDAFKRLSNDGVGGLAKAWGPQVFGAAVSAGLGIATKGLVDLDQATGQFRAQTGATTEDVQTMQQAVLGLYRNNLDSLDSLVQTNAALRTDLGLSQQAADDAEQSFLDFAHVTGQDDVQAVKALDDIGDAWGLTANGLKGVMDQLVVSHQKYGGSITDNEAALADLAPALKATNTSLDEGIGFLNLAASSGIDAASATGMLNKAIKDLKPGQTLDDLVQQISSIQDPTLRAQKAIEIFGKSGAVLANAFQPGTDSLKAYVVTAGDAAGATTKAADQINDNLENKVQLAIKNVGGLLMQFAAPAGPILSAAGSMGAAMPMITQFTGGITGIKTALDAAAVGAVADWLAILGPAAVLVGGLVMLKSAYDQQSEAGRKAAAEGGGGFDSLNSKAQEYQRQLGLLTEAYKSGAIGGTEYAAAVSNLNSEYGLATTNLHDFGAEADNNAKNIVDLSKATRDAGYEVDNFGSTVDTTTTTLRTNIDQLGTSASAGVKAVASQLSTLPTFAHGIGIDTLDKLAQGIAAARQKPVDEMSTLVELMKKPETELAETSKLLGELASSQLAEGIHSKDPVVRAQAEATRQAIIDRLGQISPDATDIGKKGGEALAAALKSKDPVVRAAAQQIERGLSAELSLASDARLWGDRTGDAWVSGIVNSIRGGQREIIGAVAVAKGPLEAHSPPGPESPLHLIDVWGERTGEAWIGGLVQGISSGGSAVANAMQGVAAQFDSGKQASPLAGAPNGGSFAAYAASQGVAYNAVSGQYQATDATFQRDQNYYDTYRRDPAQPAPVAAGGIHITVNNPTPEPASTSVQKNLTALAAFGVLG